MASSLFFVQKLRANLTFFSLPATQLAFLLEDGGPLFARLLLEPFLFPSLAVLKAANYDERHAFSFLLLFFPLTGSLTLVRAPFIFPFPLSASWLVRQTSRAFAQ